jgi:MoxR-like ATPase
MATVCEKYVPLSERYRPRGLDEIVGQPPVYFLRRLAARPHRSCWLVEGPPGTGKSAAAHVVAEELGCTAMSKHTIAGNKLNVELAETVFGSMTRFVPMDGAPFHVVIIEEFERCVSPEVRAYLKTALDTGVEPPDGLPPRCIVIATSNDVAKIEPALLERFRVLNFSAGPCFAEACQERLGAIWEAEAPGRDLPPSWLAWGWQDAGNSLRFSMRVALRMLEDYLG